MSTQSSSTAGEVLTVTDSDTYVSSSATGPVTAVLPEVDDGSGDTVAVGYEIRFEATGGSVINVETFDGRLVCRVPGRGAVVVVAEAGAQESEDDFWRWQVLANSPAAAVGNAAGTDATEIDAIRDALVDFGILKAE